MHGPAFSSVTGTTCPSGRNNCVIPIFLPRIPGLMSTSLVGQAARPAYFVYFPNALISTSTPAGRSSFIKASTVCWVGSRMSSSRLCVRISNCSRDFLSTCGERSTVVTLRDVGSGMGPATLTPVRLAVSTISVVDWSNTRWSYALRRIRMRSLSAMVALFDDVGDSAGADGPSAFANRKPQALVHGDGRDQFHFQVHVVPRHHHLRAFR